MSLLLLAVLAVPLICIVVICYEFYCFEGKILTCPGSGRLADLHWIQTMLGGGGSLVKGKGTTVPLLRSWPHAAH